MCDSFGEVQGTGSELVGLRSRVSRETSKYIYVAQLLVLQKLEELELTFIY